MSTDGGDDYALTDEPLAAEIELLGRVIAVAGEHEEQLTDAEIDEALSPDADANPVD